MLHDRRPLLFRIVGAFMLTSLFLFSGSATASPQRTALTSEMMPLSQVRAGMKGYGLTTFKGNAITRFNITVMGVMKQVNNGRDLILIRMQGGPITERGANLIRGMSGSPIYINGKLVGAFSQGEAFPKEPLGMVTPIEDMLDAWDPNIPQEPSYYKKNVASVTLPQPIRVGNRVISQIALNVPQNDARKSSDSVAVFRQTASHLSAIGVSEKNRQWLQQELNKKGYNVVITGGGQSGGNGTFAQKPLQPGSAFGTFLSVGDVQFGSTGTVTYLRGNRFLGYGHPLMGLGAMEGAVTTAYVLDVFSGVQISHHIAVAGNVIGTLRQDRDFSVAGELSKMPKLIPITITVRDATNRRQKTFVSKVFQHPDFTPALLSIATREAVTRIHNVPGDAMARVITSVEGAEVGKLTRTNYFFENADVSSVCAQDLNEMTGILSGNPFYPLPIKSANVTIDIMPGHNTASVERIFLRQGRFEPGETMEVGVVLKPYQRNPITKYIPLKIPKDTPTGRYQLLVRGGQANVLRFGGLILSGGGSDSPQTPPANVRQMVDRFNKKETNSDLVARLIFNSGSPALEGEKLADLPPNIAALMRSERNSGVRLERDEVREVMPIGMICSGTQQLTVTVVKKNTQETPSGSGSGLPSNPGLPGGSSPSFPGFGGGLNPASEDAANLLPDNHLQLSNAFEALRANPAYKPWLYTITSRGLFYSDFQEAKKAEAQPQTTASQPPANPQPATPQTPAQPTPTPPATPNLTNERPVGRQLQVWRQTARSEFSAGRLSGVSIAANGTLRLASTLKRVALSEETFIWALVSDDKGNLYAGTGPKGRILKIDTEGKLSVFATLPVISLHSLVYSKADRSLYAGGGVSGNLYKVGMDGKYKLIASIPEKYILAMAMDSKGNLFVGPGSGGSVYKFTSSSITNVNLGGSEADTPAISKIEPYQKLTADHIMALVIDQQDNLYVGSGNEGIIYRIAPNGDRKVLFDAKENAITALTVDSSGTVFAATGPKGILYRLNPEGGAAVLFDRTVQFYTGLQAAPDGTLYATTVNGLLRFFPSATDPTQPIVVAMDNTKEVDFLCMTLLPDGGVATGTGNVGEIYGFSPRKETQNANGMFTGQLVSVIRDAKIESRWGMAKWEGSAPKGSHVLIETRTGNVAEPDATWSDWAAIVASSIPNEGSIASPPARFLQYRISLEAEPGVQPAVREVSFGYLPRNQAPKVSFQAPAGGELWSKTQNLRWVGTDPDNDTLTYALQISNDGGATWRPLPTAPAATPSGSTTPTVQNPSEQLTKDLEEFERRLNQRQDISLDAKRALLEEAKQRLALNALAGGSASQRDTLKSLDTTFLPDGTYWVRVVATDKIGNPAEPQNAVAVSEPFTICNSVPQVMWLEKPQVGARGTVLLNGVVSQNLVAVTAIQVRVNGGEWIAALPKDGLFDSSREGFSFLSASLPAGKHSIETLAFNAAGGKTLEKVEVTIP